MQTKDARRTMADMAKRTVTVSLKMTSEDAARLEKAAATLWPGAPVTRSSYVLLALRGAESVLKTRRKKT